MKSDGRNLPLSTDSAEAVALFDRAVEHYLKFHIDTMSLVGRALASDPGFVMAHCLKGYLLLSAANPAHRQQIAETLAAAEANANSVTLREKQHVAAFAAWARGELDKSFAIWRQILDATPTDLLAVRICDTTWFRHGQTQKILEQADRLAPRWSADLRGYDCFQCVWAFAHEETGDYAAAERAVDAALEADRSNYFAHHVKAHVLEMDCRPREGRDWLASQVPYWSAGNNLIHHLWWHRALMELDLGERKPVQTSPGWPITFVRERNTRQQGQAVTLAGVGEEAIGESLPEPRREKVNLPVRYFLQRHDVHVCGKDDFDRSLEVRVTYEDVVGGDAKRFGRAEWSPWKKDREADEGAAANATMPLQSRDRQFYAPNVAALRGAPQARPIQRPC